MSRCQFYAHAARRTASLSIKLTSGQLTTLADKASGHRKEREQNSENSGHSS